MSPGGTAGRVLNDVGLALWLAAATAPRGPGAPRWPAWTWPSVAAHLAGAAMVTVDNRGRLLAQRGVAPVAAAKAVLTLAAVATTAWGATDRGRAPRAVTAALTAATTALNAVLGEQQRPATAARGVLRRLARV
ncbi:MAG TPA: hypothetical protein VL422_14240 [Miltoncostaea sp.]|nr:hypothetical protein [Miltoncostaea sp.]